MFVRGREDTILRCAYAWTTGTGHWRHTATDYNILARHAIPVNENESAIEISEDVIAPSSGHAKAERTEAVAASGYRLAQCAATTFAVGRIASSNRAETGVFAFN